MSNEELLNRINALQAEIDMLKSVHTIPFEVEGAFRERLNIAISSSSKTVASETQSVNEAGAGTYNVPKIFDSFVETVLADGTTVYIGIYT